MSFIWAAIVSFPWWINTLWAAYALYFIARAYHIWDQTSEYGIAKGYRHVFFGHYGKEVRLYHLIRMLFDIPPAIIGLLFPAIKKIFGLKIYTFKEKKVEKNEQQQG